MYKLFLLYTSKDLHLRVSVGKLTLVDLDLASLGTAEEDQLGGLP